MWQALFTICILTCALQHATALSFFSQVFFRMLFPKPQPKVDMAKVKPAIKRTITFQDEMRAEMSAQNSPEKMMENLVHTFIATSREIIPDEFDLPDNTYDLPLRGKLVLNSGKVHGIRSYGEPAIETALDSEGNMKFVVTFTFNNLEVVFNDMVLDYYGRLFDKKAQGKFRVLKNNFVANLNVVKTSEVFEKITKNKCVIFMTSIKALELSDISVDIFNENKKRAFYTSALVDVIITSLQEMLQRQLTVSMCDYLWSTLPHENGFVCRDSGLKDLSELIKKNQYGKKDAAEATRKAEPSAASSTVPSTPGDIPPATEQPPATIDAKVTGSDQGWFAGLRKWWNNDSPSE